MVGHRAFAALTLTSAFLLCACGHGERQLPPPPPSGGGAGLPPGTSIPGGGSAGGGDSLARPKVGAFIGVNVLADDPLDRMAVAGAVREYHPWRLCEGDDDPTYPGYPDNQNRFDLGTFSFDAFYASLKSAGIPAFPVIQGTVPWLNLADPGGKPLSPDADPRLPASYAAHADHLFQYAARYGATKVPEAQLKLSFDQTPASGLGLLRFYEDWDGADARGILPNDQPLFSPEELAAMASADYDGDLGRLGPTLGIKNADPSARMVLGGLVGKPGAAWAESITTYLDGVIAWSAANRGGSFPGDVISVQHYSAGGLDGPALSPEEDGLEARLSAIVHYRDKRLPGKEVWVTGFGYDTSGASPLRAPAIGGSSALVVQGQWIVRSYLALLAAGVDRAYLAMLRDNCGDGVCAAPLGTAGLTTGAGEGGPKPAWYFVSTLRRRLGTMVFAGEVPSGRPDVKVVRFEDTAGTGGAYAVWCPTSVGATVAGYRLPLSPSAGAAVAVALVDGDEDGVERGVVMENGSGVVDVGEMPLVVVVDSLD